MFAQGFQTQTLSHILDQNQKLRGKFIPKNINYSDLLKSCDMALSTVTTSANVAKENLFPNISTKEDYVCWLKIIKKLGYLQGDEKHVCHVHLRGLHCVFLYYLDLCLNLNVVHRCDDFLNLH